MLLRNKNNWILLLNLISMDHTWLHLKLGGKN